MIIIRSYALKRMIKALIRFNQIKTRPDQMSIDADQTERQN